MDGSVSCISVINVGWRRHSSFVQMLRTNNIKPLACWPSNYLIDIERLLTSVLNIVNVLHWKPVADDVVITGLNVLV